MYDYIVVGAGSAGCVLAARLTEDPDVEVLLIEAGPPDALDNIHIPLGVASLARSAVDWDLWTAHEPDCDAWRDAGCTGWGYGDLLPYFKHAEDNERGASDYHAVGGPLSVSDGR